MSKVEFENIIDILDEKIEIFYKPNKDIKEILQNFLSDLYKLKKENTSLPGLKELLIKDFDEEQIWSQIQILQEPLIEENINNITLISDVENILIQKEVKKKKSLKKTVENDSKKKTEKEETDFLYDDKPIDEFVNEMDEYLDDIEFKVIFI
jgi:hypothetical protein